MLYWFFQIFGAMVFGVAIDSSRFRRRVRGWVGLGVVTLLSMAVWGGCYSFQVSVLAPSLLYLQLTSFRSGYTRADIGVIPRIDFRTPGYASHIVLYIFCGITDAIWQNYAYWLIGSLSNSGTQLAYFVGFYKAIQSAGAAGVSCFLRVDVVETDFLVAGLSNGLQSDAVYDDSHHELVSRRGECSLCRSRARPPTERSFVVFSHVSRKY